MSSSSALVVVVVVEVELIEVSLDRSLRLKTVLFSLSIRRSSILLHLATISITLCDGGEDWFDFRG